MQHANCAVPKCGVIVPCDICTGRLHVHSPILRCVLQAVQLWRNGEINKVTTGPQESAAVPDRPHRLDDKVGCGVCHMICMCINCKSVLQQQQQQRKQQMSARPHESAAVPDRQHKVGAADTM
jgi:4-hydroxyphenylpyruvate dioxygenase-like putative hemolysin